MSAEEARPAVPAPPPAAPGAAVEPGRRRREDPGCFRGSEPTDGDEIRLRPGRDGLRVERAGGERLLPWGDVLGVRLMRVPSGRARVPAARLELAAGGHFDLADGLAPGSDQLPRFADGDGPDLLPVERFRLLVATVIASAGLGAVEQGVFRRGRRAEPELDVDTQPLPRWAPPVMLVLSVLVLMLVFGLGIASALALTVVLLVHELGHAVAMRLAGMKVRGVLLVPALGAATVPGHTFRNRFDEAKIALAGPITGLPLALGAIALGRMGILGPALTHDAVLFALALNVLNLIPVFPLDGGRIAVALSSGLPIRLRPSACYAPVVILTVLALSAGGEGGSFGIAVLLAFSFAMTRLNVLRFRQHDWQEAAGLRLEAIRRALRDITFAFHGVAREDVDGGVAVEPLTSRQGVLVLVYYLTELVVLLAATVVSLRLVPGLAETVGLQWLE